MHLKDQICSSQVQPTVFGQALGSGAGAPFLVVLEVNNERGWFYNLLEMEVWIAPAMPSNQDLALKWLALVRFRGKFVMLLDRIMPVSFILK